MRKRSVMAYNLITLFWFELFFFAVGNYPRHIVELGSARSLGNIFFNLVYSALFFSVLIIFFDRRKCIFSKNIFGVSESFAQRFRLKKLGLMLGIQIAVDAIGILCRSLLPEHTYFIRLILVVAGWIALFAVAVYGKNGYAPGKIKYVLTALAALLFLVALWLTVLLSAEVMHASNKYVAESETLNTILVNCNFYSDIILFVINMAMGVMFIGYAPGADDQVAKEKTTRAYTVVRTVSRIMVPMVALGFMMMIKMYIYPHDVISNIQAPSFSGDHYYDGRFYSEAQVLKVYRRDGYSDKYLCLNDGKRTVYQNGIKYGTVSVFDSDLKIELEGNTMKLPTGSEEFEVDGVKVSVFENQAFAYVSDSGAKFIPFEDIYNSDEDEFLTEMCKYQIEKGNIVIFGYAVDYLADCDPGFIKPYITRYANGDFTDAELEYFKVSEYKQSYITQIAAERK